MSWSSLSPNDKGIEELAELQERLRRSPATSPCDAAGDENTDTAETELEGRSSPAIPDASGSASLSVSSANRFLRIQLSIVPFPRTGEVGSFFLRPPGMAYVPSSSSTVALLQTVSPESKLQNPSPKSKSTVQNPKIKSKPSQTNPNHCLCFNYLVAMTAYSHKNLTATRI